MSSSGKWFGVGINNRYQRVSRVEKLGWLNGRIIEWFIIAKDYATLDFVNSRWPGHVVLVPPAPSHRRACPLGLR